jgi:competence protein ComEA
VFIPEKIKPVVEGNALARSKSKTSTAAGGTININTASEKELDDLPGIGPSTAKKIIESRPFSKLEDLLKIARFGKSRLEKLKDRICL